MINFPGARRWGVLPVRWQEWRWPPGYLDRHWQSPLPLQNQAPVTILQPAAALSPLVDTIKTVSAF